jgi:hypothetical protein
VRFNRRGDNYIDNFRRENSNLVPTELRIAAFHGSNDGYWVVHLDAIEYRNNIEKIMAPDQVAEAKQREVSG